jgi:NADH-quinone oxidoreductase subunit N
MSAAIQSIDYTAILPVLIVAGGALLLLVADLFLDDVDRPLLSWGAAGILVAALVAQTVLWAERTSQPRQTFCLNGAASARIGLCSYSVDNLSLTLQTLALAATLLVVLMAPRKYDVPFGEYHFLLLSSLAGALVLVAARDFVSVTVALETLSLPAFALVGFGRRAGGEAALKFFLMSVASTAIMLFGISLVYGTTGSVYFAGIQRTMAATGFHAPVFAVAAVLTLVGFGFKISAVPFHFWTPEVYAGAPVPVAAYLSVVSKAAGFAGLILTVEIAFRSYLPSVATLIAVLAAVTMSVGNVIALRQRSAVRLLAWSTVAQAGYVLVPLAVTSWDGAPYSTTAIVSANGLGPAVGASVAYLVLYTVMNLGAFGVVSTLATDGSGGPLSRYRGLYRDNPQLALPMAFFLLCLAGLPPGVMGLFAKVAVFKAAVSGNLVWLAVIMAVNVVVALYYYLRWAALMFAGPAAVPIAAGTPETAAALGGVVGSGAEGGGAGVGTVIRPIPLPIAPRLAVAIALVLAVVFSFWPNPALDALTLR